MKIYEILNEDGRIVKGVNTTVDVGPNEIKTQAAKFGNTVDKDGVPPTLSKKVKGASTNVAFNIGLAEALELADRLDEGPIDWIKKKLIKLAGNYVLGKAEDTFVQLINDPDIKPILDNPELLKQRPEFKAASAQEKEEMIDAIIDLIQLRAQYKSNPNWKKQVMGNMGEGFDPVGWLKSSFNPDPQYKAWKKLFKQNPAQAKKMFRTNHRQYLAMYQNESISENFADGKKPGRKGLAKRSGVNTKASVSSLRKTAKNSSGEKQRMAHWLANMKAGKA